MRVPPSVSSASTTDLYASATHLDISSHFRTQLVLHSHPILKNVSASCWNARLNGYFIPFPLRSQIWGTGRTCRRDKSVRSLGIYPISRTRKFCSDKTHVTCRGNLIQRSARLRTLSFIVICPGQCAADVRLTFTWTQDNNL